MHEGLDFFTATARLGELTTFDLDAAMLVHRVELSGDAFYQALADRIDHPEAAELLRRNGREETGHARRIRRMIAIMQGDDWVAPAELDEPFEVSVPELIPLELFDVIVAAEMSGDAGYQGWADSVDDEEIKRLLLLNGREETIHGERAAQARALLAGS